MCIRDRDLQNLVMQTEKRWDMYLTWQTMEIELVNVGDLLESPVLFISGKGSMQLTTKQKTVLQQYVNQGGFLFVEMRAVMHSLIRNSVC